MGREGTVGIPLESKQGNQPSSLNEMGNTGYFSSCSRKLGVPLESLKWNRASSRVEEGNSGYLSSCDRDLRVPIEFQHGVRPQLLLRHGT